MRRAFCFAVCVLVPMLSVPTWAVGAGARLHYVVDPAGCTPAATVAQNSEGVTVVIFRVASIQPGDVFTLNLSLLCKNAKVHYPFSASLDASDSGKVLVVFDHPSVDLVAAGSEVGSQATLTVTAAGAAAHKVVVELKGQPAPDSHVGKGPGVKVVIVRGKTTEGVNQEEQVLLDVLEALTPEEPMESPEQPW